MECRLAQKNDKARWNEFIYSEPSGSFMQTWQWASIQEILGNTFWRYIVEGGGEVVGVFFVVRRDLPFGRSWLYIPRGPVVAEKNIQNKKVWQCIESTVRALAKEQGAIFVRIDPSMSSYPNFLNNWKPSDRQVQPQHTLLLNLSASEEDLLTNMHSKTRYNVRLAEKKGVTVRFSTALKDIDVFLSLAKEVHSRTQFRFHPPNYYRAMLAALSPNHMFEIAIAEHSGQPLAAHLMVYAGGVATYVHGASSHEKRSFMAPQYVYWKTIQRAKEKKCHTFDFYGVAPKNAQKNHSWSGITRVKEGFGGTRKSFAGARDLVMSEGMYEMFNIARYVTRFF